MRGETVTSSRFDLARKINGGRDPERIRSIDRSAVCSIECRGECGCQLSAMLVVWSVDQDREDVHPGKAIRRGMRAE